LIPENADMTRFAIAAAASLVLIAAYALSPLAAVAIAAAASAVLTAAVAIALRRAERDEIAHVMEIIDACVAVEEPAPLGARMVS